MEEITQEYKRFTPEEILERIKAMQGGRLKIYIGAAPGVGKTFHMLKDAHALRGKGIDVVIGFVEPHGREATRAEIGDLEYVLKKTIWYKGKEFQEMDVEAIISRDPDVVLVDELAHTNVLGVKNKKRYEDVREILRAGIHVWTAVNIQHFESVRDIVSRITGIQMNERVPDSVLREAHEVEVIDVSPETLRDRIKEGKVYEKNKIEQALNHFFQKGNLISLRELVFREVADDIELRLEKECLELGIHQPTGVHEKILVCVNYRRNAEKLIRRGSRIATRLNADLYILHIQASAGETPESGLEEMKGWENLSRELNAQFLVRKGKSGRIAECIISVCVEYKITQIIIGMSARTRWEEIWKGSIVNNIMKRLQCVDVHIVSDR